MAGTFRVAVLALLVGAPACERSPVPPADVVLRVTTTRGAPVSGAEVRLESSVVARSDEEGMARLQIQTAGREGESIELNVQCPAPLRSPKQPVTVRRLAIQGGEIVHEVKCEETRRTLVVAIRAENGPDLPILHLGREIGRTDRSGAAHLMVDADTHERVELTLSTASEEMAGVHPQNPGAAFEPAEYDEVRVWAEKFTRDPKKRPPKTRPKGPQVF